MKTPPVAIQMSLQKPDQTVLEKVPHNKMNRLRHRKKK